MDKDKISCPYCGNNPVNHWLAWYFESCNVLFTPLRQTLLYNPFSRKLKKVFLKWRIPWLAARFFIFLKIFKVQGDIKACKVRRAVVLWEEAEKRGIKMQELRLLGKGLDLYLAQKENRKLVFSGLPRPEGYNDAVLDVMDDKAYLKKIFLKAGLPAPKGGSAATLSSALKIFNSALKPVIVKPRTGSRGRHTTTFVSTENDFKQAYYIAKRLCHWAVVEEQLFGPVYRATVIDFHLAGVLRGDPPQITGDGIRSAAELIKIKNSLPHPEVKDIAVDKGTEIFLARQGLALFSVLKPGETINLSEKIGVNYGGSSSEDFEICHPDNRELFVRAARILGDPIVGFDFIIPDIAKSYKEQRCGFIEANSLPFINLHHDPLRGNPRNAAAMVWEMLGF